MIYDICDPKYWDKPFIIGPPPQWVITRWECKKGAARWGDFE